jgi:hypothetical protein
MITKPPLPVARMQRSEIRGDTVPDSGLRPASRLREASGLRDEGSSPLWSRGELALFHPWFHDDWADEFAVIANDEGAWGFGDLLPGNAPETPTWKTR